MASKPTSRQEALDYHSQGRPGKIEVVSTKPTNNQYDLSLAYSPGVAEPCREIAEDVSKVYDYTARGNLVAVISDGSAVLGLGNIGPEASKPVMEGKGVLFKRFADIDVFDIELATQDVDEIVAAVKAIAPTVSGINLEDISAPRCFEIERRLQAELDIPVFHDDQHGTALISGAALLNACEIAGKKLDEIKLVINGAGASAMACARFAIGLGVQPRNLLMCDSTGVIYAGRTDRMSSYKEDFAVETEARTLAEALVGADAFYGLSVGNVMSPEMLLSMAENPIVFAMANPDPEIPFELAKSTREDVIIGTGRSDHPNQVNNVLGFPFVFRGALDVRASHITNEMLYAAAHALADLAKEPVPTQIAQAYGLDSLEFGRDYIIPKPIDHRVIRRVAPAVAQAAMDSGVARKEVDLAAYTRQLGEGLGLHRNLMNEIVAKARQAAKQIVFPEGEADRIVISAGALVQERIAHPILLGRRAVIEAKAKLHGIDLGHSEIIDPAQFDKLEEYAQDHVKLRAHRGVDLDKARERMHDPLWLGPTMVRHGDADGMVCGVTRAARKTIAAMLRVIPLAGGVRRASALSLVFSKTHGRWGTADKLVPKVLICSDLETNGVFE